VKDIVYYKIRKRNKKIDIDEEIIIKVKIKIKMKIEDVKRQSRILSSMKRLKY